MMRPVSLICLFSLILSLAACAGFGGPPRVATSAEAMDRLGRPTDVRRAPGGDELWDYVKGPSGFVTWRLRIAPGGRVTEVTQLVSEERLMMIEPGKSTKADVELLLGRPSEIDFLRTGEAWSWRTLIGAMPGHIAVTFNPDGTARERMALRDPTIDDDHE